MLRQGQHIAARDLFEISSQVSAKRVTDSDRVDPREHRQQ
jgi:hypothetical protein